MPLIRKWRRLGLAGQLAVLLSFAITIIGALVVSLAALASSHSAGQDAKGAVGCVNNVLGARSDLTKESAQAQKAFALADENYNAAINQIIRAAGHSTPTQGAALRLQFAAASARKSAASNAYFSTMSHIYAVAAAHPLGHC